MDGGAPAERPECLPALESGITLLIDPDRSTRPHRLVLGQRSEGGGHVLWVDARDRASSYVLYGLAADKRLLDRIEIARAWTAYQHHTLIRSLVDRTTPRTRLLVLPDVGALYRDDDVDATVGERLLESSLETVAELARVAEVPALITGTPDDRSTLEQYADATLRGDRAAPTGETGWQSDRDARWLQTTIPQWTRGVGERTDPAPLAVHRDRMRQTVLAPRQGF